MQLWLCPVFAFLLGSIPFGLIIAKAKGIEIREHGSGNIGATNVLRVIGKRYGFTCLFLDALKGFIPVLIAVNLIQIAGRTIQMPLGFLDSWALVLPTAEAMKGKRSTFSRRSPPCWATITRHGSASRAARALPPRLECCWL